MSEPRILYITLYYLRTDSNGQNKYHWGIYATDDSPPIGCLFHATDANRNPLDLYYECRSVSDPMRSQAMIVCLKIGDASSSTAIDRCLSRVSLMSRSSLPAGERQWTCRVYVKEALKALENEGLLRLLASVDSIERACLAAANAFLPYRSRSRLPSLYNNLAWMDSSTSHRTPTDVTPDLYYPSNREVDSTESYTSSRSATGLSFLWRT